MNCGTNPFLCTEHSSFFLTQSHLNVLKMCLLQAGAANAGTCGLQRGVLETKEDQISAKTQTWHQGISLLFLSVEKLFAEDWR